MIMEWNLVIIKYCPENGMYIMYYMYISYKLTKTELYDTVYENYNYYGQGIIIITFCRRYNI